MNHHPLYTGLSQQTDLLPSPLLAKQRCSHLSHAVSTSTLSTTTASANIKALHDTEGDEEEELHIYAMYAMLHNHAVWYMNYDAVTLLICSDYMYNVHVKKI